MATGSGGVRRKTATSTTNPIKKETMKRTTGSRNKQVNVPALDPAHDGRADLRTAQRDEVLVPSGLAPLLGELRLTATRSRGKYLLDRLERLQQRMALSSEPSLKQIFKMNPEGGDFK